MAKFSASLLALLLLMALHSSFAARNMQMTSNSKSQNNVVDATRKSPSGDHNKDGHGLTDNKNFVYSGIGSFGGIGGASGIVGPLGGIGGVAGIGGGAGIGTIGLLPVGGVVGGVGGGVGGGAGGIIP